MANGNSVLRALSILSLEEILKLSSADKEILSFEQVAGGEWSGSAPAKRAAVEAKVISFPSPEREKVQIKDIEPLPEAGTASGEVLNELSLDFILTQRKLWKQGVESMGLAVAIEEYLHQMQVISVKEKSSNELETKAKIRFITTQGLLINKKHS